MLRALAVAVLILVTGPHARAESWERFTGSVSTATPDAPGEEPLRAARCAHLHDPNHNGLLAFVIDLPERAADGAHRFRLLDGNMSAVDGLIDEPANFDVAFYADLGTCEAIPAPASVRFRGPWNEEGIVPQGTRFALVTLTNKVHSSFDFLLAT